MKYLSPSSTGRSEAQLSTGEFIAFQFKVKSWPSGAQKERKILLAFKTIPEGAVGL